LFGGITGCGNPCYTTGDTWELSGVTWTSLAPVNSPSPRGFMEGSSDTAANVLMFYGGWKGDFQGGSTTAPPTGFYGDTWQFAAGRWSNVTAGTSGSPGPDAWNMDYDPSYTAILGFGGWGTQFSGSSTWSFAGPVSLPALTVGISANRTSGTAPLAVFFSGTATGGTPPYSWNYSFGDGSYNNCCSSLSHTYPRAGTFIANLTVRDSNGAVGYKTATITVTPASSVAVSLSANPSGGSPPLTVYFNGGASGGTGPYTFRWSFGDGSVVTWSNASTGGRIAYTYASTGTFVANLTATDQVGSTAWQTVTLAVGTSPPPSVALSANPTTGPYPLTVYFQGSASGGSSPYAFLWTFGDGTSLNWTNTSTTVRVAHTFTAGGNFQVSLRATDASGASAEHSLFVSVTVPGSTSPLSSTVTLSPLSGTPPLSVSLASSIQGGKGPYTWVWFLADGTPSFWQNCSSPNCPTFQHTYSNRGTYMVEAELSDSSPPSQVNRHYTNVTVGAGGPGNSLSVNVKCQPSTSNGPPGGTAPLSISCQASATGGVPPYTFRWNIENSTYFSTSGINYTFQNPGDYYVNLTATDHVGNKAYTSGIVHVTPGSGPGTGGIGSGGPLNLGAPGGVPTLVVLIAVVGLFAAGIAQFALARRRRKALIEAGAAATLGGASGGSTPMSTAWPVTVPAATPVEPPSIVGDTAPPAGPPAEPGAGTQAPPPAAGVRKCTSCGAEVEAGAGFCDSCGSPVVEVGPST
ncbi:MAG: PKD domain-containing protein, partial [Euryarchaeota archaeon]|nr:PKD domain-containing protein [Euryarchaeota archaeon]